MLDHIVANAQSAIAKLRVRSALNPLLWLCGIVSVPCFLAALRYDTSPLALPLMYIGSVPVGCTVLGFFWFAIMDPARLQSEEYQLRHEAMEVIRQKGSPVQITPASLEAIANPVLQEIPRGKEQ